LRIQFCSAFLRKEDLVPVRTRKGWFQRRQTNDLFGDFVINKICAFLG
jgi:hypothetical protein